MFETYSLGFSDKTVRTVFQSGDSRMMQLSLEAGEGLEKHMTKTAIALVVLSGKVTFTSESQTTELSPLQMITLPPLQEHAVKAQEKSILLLNLMPAVKPQTVMQDEAVETIYSHPELRDKIAPELLPFVDDHVQVCQALDKLGPQFEIADAAQVLQLVSDELNRHFCYEEDLLFPRLANVLGGADVGPVPKLLQEHRKIRLLHDTCSRLVERWYEDKAVQGTLEMELQELSRYLLQHIAKEDSHLFSMASRVLSQEEKQAIAAEYAEREQSAAS